MSNIITKSTGAVSDINDSSEQAESAHKDIPDFSLVPVTNSQYDDLMYDLNSDPEFDKILAEMLPNSGENIVPVVSASSAIARSPHNGAVSNVFPCNHQWNAVFQTFPQPVVTDQNAQITINYNIIQLLVFRETNIRIYWCAKGDIDRCKAEASVTFRTPINFDIGLFKHL